MPASPFVRGVPFAVLAAAIPLVAPPVAAAAMAEPSTPSVYCTTHELTAEQIDAGAISEIACYPTLESSLEAAGLEVPDGVDGPTALAAQAEAGGVVAVHYMSSSGSGDYLTVLGNGCDGGGLSFAAGDKWNDAIVSTRHRLCSQVKHFSDANYGGSIQNTYGYNGQLNVLSSPLARQVSSIRYYGTLNP
jgi:hypothetical protein